MDLELAQGNFEYKPLEDGTRQIRLLSINLGRGEDIICSLRSTLISEIKYHALSYTWGHATTMLPIYLNGSKVLIRENLWWAIWYLREKRYNPFLLWIDAICIDQANVTERNAQVAMMSDIYSSATSVIVWLGRSSRTYDQAMDFLTMIYEDDRSRLPPGYIIKGQNHVSLFYGREQRLQSWEAVLQLLQLEYWRRVWIVQEIALAGEIYLHCGTKRIPWEALDRAYEQMREFDASPVQMQEFSQKVAVRLMRTRAHLNEGVDLITLLQTCEDTLCMDLRDKIFGFLGLARRCGGLRHGFQELKADYSMSLGKVYEKMLKLRSYDHFEEWMTASHLERQFGACVSVGDDRALENRLETYHDIRATIVDNHISSTVRFSQFLQRLLRDAAVTAFDIGEKVDKCLGWHHRFPARGILCGQLDKFLSSMTEGQHAEAPLDSVDIERLRPFIGNTSNIGKMPNIAISEDCGKRGKIFLQDWEDANLLSDKDYVGYTCCGLPAINTNDRNTSVDGMSQIFSMEGFPAIITGYTAQVGDWLCIFKGCDVAAIVRHVEDFTEHRCSNAEVITRIRKEYHLVGRAMITRRQGEKVRVTDQSTQIFSHHVPIIAEIQSAFGKIDFYFDTGTLSYLTW